jgi:hypothetical protein
LALDGVTVVPEIRQPFDVVAEGLLSERSRGDWTRLELFIGGIRGWGARLQRFFVERLS